MSFCSVPHIRFCTHSFWLLAFIFTWTMQFGRYNKPWHFVFSIWYVSVAIPHSTKHIYWNRGCLCLFCRPIERKNFHHISICAFTQLIFKNYSKISNRCWIFVVFSIQCQRMWSVFGVHMYSVAYNIAWPFSQFSFVRFLVLFYVMAMAIVWNALRLFSHFVRSSNRVAGNFEVIHFSRTRSKRK